MTLTLEIKEKTQKSLEQFASENGKPVTQLATEIVDDFVGRTTIDRHESFTFMKLAASTFSEWDYEEDSIYDNI